MKTFFSSFRNAFFSIVCAIVVLAVVGVGVTYAIKADEKNILDRNTALEYALKDAGVSESDITITRQKLDQENGRNCYEIEFFTDSYEYKYEIDANTGTVAGVSIEALFDGPGMLADNSSGNPEGSALSEQPDSQDASQSGSQQSGQSSDNQQSNNQQSGSQQSGQSSGNQQSNNQQSGQSGLDTSGVSNGTGAAGSGSTYIGIDRAKEIAVGDAGVQLSDVIFTKNKLDLDDGIYIYEMEFYTTSAEYEYEINAVTGAVLDKDVEMFQTDETTQAVNAGSYIGVDRAKEIAVGHAGFSVSDVDFTKAKVERDDGCTQYEIEFCHGTSDYEYCIDAFSGNILKYDCDHNGYDHDGYDHNGHYDHH